MSKRQLKMYLFCLKLGVSLFVLNSCDKVGFTRPFCGPQSIGQDPPAVIPKEYFGCYEFLFEGFVATMNGSFRRPTVIKRNLIWLEDFVDGAVGKTTWKDFDRKGLICDADKTNKEGPAYYVMGKSNNFWTASLIRFNSGGQSISFSSLLLDLRRIKERKIPYIIMPGGNFLSSAKTPSSYLESRSFNNDSRFTLVDNREASMEDLAAIISSDSFPWVEALKRVPDEECKKTPMRSFKIKQDSSGVLSL